MDALITILLATYNGEQYIRHQLDSIISQSYSNWHLLIRDDCSTDSTPAIIKEYQQQYSNKIDIVPNNGRNLGSLLNFGALLSATNNAIYIMFCDQDDEWVHNKIETTYAAMCALEKQHGADYPIMVFTNFQYVDEHMQVIKSRKNFEINRIENFGFKHLLAQNPVYGCTSIINRALADKVGIIPPDADFHDHWIALIAAAFGKLHYLKDKTVLYRQHNRNISGSFDNSSFKKRFERIFVQQKNFKDAKAKYGLLLSFKQKYYSELSRQQQDVLDDFLCLYNTKNPLYILKNIRHGVRSQTLVQSMLLYFTIFLIKNPLKHSAV